MNNLSNYLKLVKPAPVKKERGITNERQWLFSQIIKRIDRSRRGTKFKPVVPKRFCSSMNRVYKDIEHIRAYVHDEKYRNMTDSKFSMTVYKNLKNK